MTHSKVGGQLKWTILGEICGALTFTDWWRDLHRSWNPRYTTQTYPGVPGSEINQPLSTTIVAAC